jgi:hypothetical protein
MSALFRGKFLSHLKSTFESGDLIFPGGIGHLREPRAFEMYRRQFYHKNWVVYCKPPFDGAEGVLQYLGRYTHRIAISNNRIISVEGGNVSFHWRDYSDGDKKTIMTLKTNEFISRFLLHVLPDRYVRIRHFGLLANRRRKDNMTQCRALLDISRTTAKKRKETWQEQLLRITGIDVFVCPVCQKGRMFRVDELPPSRCNSPPVQYR